MVHLLRVATTIAYEVAELHRVVAQDVVGLVFLKKLEGKKKEERALSLFVFFFFGQLLYLILFFFPSLK